MMGLKSSSALAKVAFSYVSFKLISVNARTAETNEKRQVSRYVYKPKTLSKQSIISVTVSGSIGVGVRCSTSVICPNATS
jgi:hypothetical protein